MWFEREDIGTTMTVVRADKVTVGNMIWSGSWDHKPAESFMVTTIELVGDDVIFHSFGVEKFTTSIGNAVIVEVES